MPNRHFGNNSRRSRPNRGFQSNRPASAGRGQRRGSFRGDVIDISLFINKIQAVQPADQVAVQSSFGDYALHPLLKRAIEAKGYKQPMPIQEQAIPAILTGQDVIGLANTGTGKTGAFLIPMIHKLLNKPADRLLILTPTRELALQIQDEFIELTKGIRLKSVVLVGGANIRPQIMALRARPNVIIATPGRLKDLLERKALCLSNFNNIVLDEADQMLDKGFLPEVKHLLTLVASQRQTLLFSATLPAEIEKLINAFLKNPQKISIKTRETSAQVHQDVVRIGQDENKVDKLHDLLIQTEFQKVLVFTRTKWGAEKLSRILYQRGFKAESIHGDKPHAKRLRTLKMFKEDQLEILVATDIAARGLDIPDVSHVINYDIPATYADYVHRIGRTGRAEKTGKALTFIG